MSDDYVIPSFRKSRRDKKMKRLYRIYKRGGKYRGSEVKEGSGKIK